MVDDGTVGIGAAAQFLDVSIKTLRRLADSGEVPSVRSAGGHRRFRLEDLHRTLLVTEAKNTDRVDLPRGSFVHQIAGLDESDVWRELRRSLEDAAGELEPRARAVLAYCTTEMVNNAIDHSGGTTCRVEWSLDGSTVHVQVSDDGVGAFARLAEGLGLPTPADALFELTKGKRTTMRDRHSGEGIFFTSKAVDQFDIAANGLRLVVDNERGDIATGETSERGTVVAFAVDITRPVDLVELFARYSVDHEFTRSTPRLELVRHEGEFISRSEAKRVSAGLEQFRSVEVDFTDVPLIGQGFADELFRVWAGEHPQTALVPIGMNPGVELMVRRVARPD